MTPREELTRRFPVLPTIVVGGIILLSLMNLFAAVNLPEQQFLHGIVLDDTVYYSKIATNVVNGHGFTFDGLNPTNGFQPLWQLIVVGLAYYVEDQIQLLRLMSAVSGVLWIGAGLLVYRAVRGYLGEYPSLLVLAGLLLTPNLQMISLRGMETGIFAFLLAALLYLLERDYDRLFQLDQEVPAGRFLTLGAVMGLLGLARVDAYIFSMLALLGIVIANRPAIWRPKVVGMALVPAVIGSAYVLWNLTAFGNLTPVSGSVKRFYVQQASAGTSFSNDLWLMVRYIFDMSTHLFTRVIEVIAWKEYQLPIEGQRLVTLLGLLFLAGMLALVLVPQFRRTWAAGFNRLIYLNALMGTGVVLHLALFVLLLPNFLIYGTWYYVPQYMALWILIGFLAAALARSLRRAVWLGVALSVVTLGWMGYASAWYFTKGGIGLDVRTSVFERAGVWLNQNLPPNQRIGAFSSGILALKATNHTVVNLDGLVNSKEYLDEYLKPGKFPAFIHQNQIGYLADYFPYGSLKTGVSWQGNIPLDQLTVVKWWPIDAETAYVIFRVNEVAGPPGSPSDMPVVDPLAQAEFRGKVLGQGTVTDLEGAKKSVVAGAVPVSSFAVGDGVEFLSLERSQALAVAQGGLGQLERAFGPRVASFGRQNVVLLDFHLSAAEVVPGQTITMTRTWLIQEPLGSDLRIDTYINPSSPAWLWHLTKGQHDLLSIGRGEKGQLFKETYRLTIPADLPPGVYPVTIGLWDEAQTRWVPHDGRQIKGRENMVFTGSLTVRPR